MSTRKIISFVAVVGVLFAGVWFLAGSGSVGAETVEHATALRALGPAGISTSSSMSDQGETYDPIYPVQVIAREVEPKYVESQYEQWLNGKIDIENESRASDAEVAALKEAAMKLPVGSVDIASMEGLSLVAGTAFDSIDVDDCCGDQSYGTTVPPDSEMAAGPDHLIAVVNVAMEIYDKSGTSLLGPTGLETFFSANTDCTGVFDPTVIYDKEADRWVVGIDADGDFFCYAASATADPTGAWNVYSVPAAIMGAFHDYPHTGIGQDAIFVGANQFGGTVPGGFEGRVWAMDKMASYAGSPVTPVTFSAGFDGSTPQPLHMHDFTFPAGGPPAPHYFVTDFYDGCTQEIWEWPDPLGGGVPSIVASFDLCTATGVAGGFPIDVHQSGGSDIQANDWRSRKMEGTPSGNGHAWVTDTISCDPGAGTVDCVRWNEIDLTTPTPTLVQAGVYASDGEFRTFPDLAVDVCDNMAIGFTKTSSSTFPGMWVAGRESGDPAGTLQGEMLVKAGDEAYVSFDGPPHRWGDYSGMTLDPDGTTFWYLSEYSKSGTSAAANWGNYISAFSFPSCDGSTASPQDKIYEVEVRSSGGPEPDAVLFSDCLRFGDPDVAGEFIADGLGIGKWREIADLGDRFIWNAKAGSGGVTIRFKGISKSDGNIRGRASSSTGINYKFRGFENPACGVPPLEGATWGD